MKFHLRQNGAKIGYIELPAIPRRGDMISCINPKFPRYLVLRVEFFSDNAEINLHVKEFFNETSAEIEVDGLNNIRPFD